jgi:hypothetical protein
MPSSRTIKPSHLEEIWQRFQLMNRSDILTELRVLMDTIERLTINRQGPITEAEICASLPHLPQAKRETYLTALEKAGHITTCYGGHDSRRTGWRVNSATPAMRVSHRDTED